MEIKNLKKVVRSRLFLGYHRLGEKDLAEDEINQRIQDICDKLEEEQKISIPENQRILLKAQITSDLLGWGPVQPFMDDPEVTEIMVNGPDKVYIEKNGKKQMVDAKFDDESHLRYIVERMLRPTGRRVDESYPYVDFSLADGSRVNVIIPPVSVGGASLTIRKFLKNIEKAEDLVAVSTMDKKMSDFLIGCVRAKVNIIFSGATGVGKTTTLEVLSSYIASDERIITIEDALELHLRQSHVVRLLTRAPNIEGKGSISIRDLFINTLRMRPSRIILGEIRGSEALDFLQALNSGHRGSLAVIHASSPEDVITRLETAVFYSGTMLPVWAIRHQISQGLDVVVQQEQLVDGSRRITRISEVAGLDDNNNVIIKDLFRFNQRDTDESGQVMGEFVPVGTVPRFMDKFSKMGINISEDIFRKT